jgi:hypothetical protein
MQYAPSVEQGFRMPRSDRSASFCLQGGRQGACGPAPVWCWPVQSDGMEPMEADNVEEKQTAFEGSPELAGT